MSEVRDKKLAKMEKQIMKLVELSQKNISSIEKNCDILRKMNQIASKTGDPSDERKVKKGIHKISENNFKYFSENKKILKEFALLKNKIIKRKDSKKTHLHDYEGLIRLIEFQIDGVFRLNELKMKIYLQVHREYEDLVKNKTIRRIKNIDPNLEIDSEKVGKDIEWAE
jgi:hypothetical protein